MFKEILLLILSTVIVFFVWNSLKRMFYTKFYSQNPLAPKKDEPVKPKQSGVKWDAETVDFEEIKDPKE